MIKMSMHSPDTVFVSEIDGISTNFKFPLKKMYRDYDIRRSDILKPKGTHKASLCRSITGLGRGKQEPFKEFLSVYNITFNNLLKHVRGFAYNELVLPFEHLINSMCRSHSKGSYDWYIIDSLNKRKDAITTLKEDGLYHLTPLVIFLLKDTDQPCKVLKEMFGKGVWKELCKNSFTRNCLIAKAIWKNSSSHTASKLYTAPSSLLKYGTGSVIHAYLSSRDYAYLEWFKVSDHKNYTNFLQWWRIAEDACDMQDKLLRLKNKHVDRKSLKKKIYKMEPKELRIYHDNITLEYEELRDKATKEPIDWIINTFEISGEVSDTPYRILKSPLEIRQEGRKMHHCVGMYDSRVIDKEYLVVSVDPCGDNPSTLGLRVVLDDDKMFLEMNQHYYACNKPVDAWRKDIGYEIIKKLNKEIKHEL